MTIQSQASITAQAQMRAAAVQAMQSMIAMEVIFIGTNAVTAAMSGVVISKADLAKNHCLTRAEADEVLKGANNKSIKLYRMSKRDNSGKYIAEMNNINREIRKIGNRRICNEQQTVWEYWGFRLMPYDVSEQDTTNIGLRTYRYNQPERWPPCWRFWYPYSR
jgi:hypothetical protein